LLQNSTFSSLIIINILAFISSPTWSDLMFIIIWSVAPFRLVQHVLAPYFMHFCVECSANL
jgi:hypothetical protein